MDFTHSSSDEQLMKAYQKGSEGAFDLLFKRHSSRVYGFLMNRLRDRAQTDDVFQATFLKLHQSRALYDSRFSFAPWLFTICKSVLTDQIRKQKRLREDFNDQFVSEAVDSKTFSPTSPIDLEGLTPNQRVAIELRYQEEFDFKQIAARLETSPQNVRKLISRGLQKLKFLNVSKGKPDDQA